MNSRTPRIAVAIVLAGGACLLSAALGQQRAGARPHSQPPLRVALVDLKQIFEGYKKTGEYKVEIEGAGEAAQTKARAMMEKLKAIQEQLQKGEIEQGGPEWIACEEKAIGLTNKLKLLETQTKKEITRKQADAALATYRDIEDALARFAEYNGYTLVLQISHELLDGSDPGLISRQIGQNVIYRRDAEDITAPVLSWLNRHYDAELAAGQKNPPAPTETSPGRSAARPAGLPNSKKTAR